MTVTRNQLARSTDRLDRFADDLAGLALAAQREIETATIKGRPVALAVEHGERPGAIVSPALRLLARAAKQDLQRLAEVERLK